MVVGVCLSVEEMRMQENKKFTHLWHNIFLRYGFSGGSLQSACLVLVFVLGYWDFCHQGKILCFLCVNKMASKAL
jgi:hypothetical protein